MLPYGSLWKLDQMMQEATAAENRKHKPINYRDHQRFVLRQRLAYVLIAIIVISLFTLPYYLTHMRLLVHRLEKEKKGLAPIDGLSEENKMKFKLAISEMRTRLRDAKEIEVQKFEQWMLFSPDLPLHPSQREQLEHLLIQVGGSGAGSLWPFVEGSSYSILASKSPAAAASGSDPTSLSFFDASSPSCIAVTTATPSTTEGETNGNNANDSTTPAASVLFPDVGSSMVSTSDALVSSWSTAVFGALLSGITTASQSFHSCRTRLRPAEHVHVACICGGGNAARGPIFVSVSHNPSGEFFMCEDKCRD